MTRGDIHRVRLSIVEMRSLDGALEFVHPRREIDGFRLSSGR
jgi:hypothetical protein